MSEVGGNRARIAGVLLAAGGSSRMGSAKQLLRYEGRSLVRRAAETALASGCDALFAVVGSSADAVAVELSGLPLEVVTADDWREGMSRSIRCGVEAVASSPRGFDAALVLLADQPDVTVAHLDRLIAAYRSERAATAATAYAGTLGAPALFARSRFDALCGLDGDQGARSLLRDDPGVVRVPFEAAARDIDTPEDIAP